MQSSIVLSHRCIRGACSFAAVQGCIAGQVVDSDGLVIMFNMGVAIGP